MKRSKKLSPAFAVELIRDWKTDAKLRAEFGNFQRYLGYFVASRTFESEVGHGTR